MSDEIDVAEQFEKHLSSPKQSWLLGAGVSFPANIPLMSALTTRVLNLARTERFSDDNEALEILDFVTEDCGGNSHIEHHLTHLGDLISIAQRSHTGEVAIGGHQATKAKLTEVHTGLLTEIASTVRWGFKAAETDSEGAVIHAAQVGSDGKSIVDITGHLEFVRAVFETNRAGLDFTRAPVDLFTTNYDTLIEDALALAGVEYQDGFVGGGVGFWGIHNYTPRAGTRAIVSKLHGSIDWFRGVSPNLLRVRHGDTYPGHGGTVMIYPQATKYVNTQRDPFAEIFQRFRARLAAGSDHVLLICGYSFGDDHINAEIDIAMSTPKSQLTILAFSDESNSGLPQTLVEWLRGPWGKRLFVASPNGLYRGSTDPVFPAPTGQRGWWTLEGVSTLLSTGLPKDIKEALA